MTKTDILKSEFIVLYTSDNGLLAVLLFIFCMLSVFVQFTMLQRLQHIENRFDKQLRIMYTTDSDSETPTDPIHH